MKNKIKLIVALSFVLCIGTLTAGAEENETPVTITMQHSMVPPEANDLLKQYAEQYKEETGVTVEISYVPWENQRATTLSKIASGQTPDILHGNSNQGTVEFVEMGAMSDLSDLLS